MFNKQVGETMIPRDRLNKALLTLKVFLMLMRKNNNSGEILDNGVKSACIFQRYVDLRKEIRT